MVKSATAVITRENCSRQQGNGPWGPVIRVAVLGTHSVPTGFVERLFDGADWCIPEHTELSDDVSDSVLGRFDAAVLLDGTTGHPTDAQTREAALDRQLDRLSRLGVGVLILTERPWVFAGCNIGTVCLPHASCVDKVHGVLLAQARLRPVLRQINSELASMHRLGANLNQYFEEVDRELQLASRLQRDFLPRTLPEVGPIRFSTLYRPCGWVSGDIFDVFRLDETHLGFYLADAVGHGVAAGLLTMYIKHAIRPKRILPDGYELIRPSEILGALNDQFTDHALPDSQFITAWYGMLNVQTLELRYAVAGHPPPLLIDRDGEIRELNGKGCILGVFAEQEYADRSVVLQAGQRVLLFSDGLEPTIIAHRPSSSPGPVLQPGIPQLLRLPPQEMKARLIARLDASPCSLRRADDVSLIVVDVAADAGRHA